MATSASLSTYVIGGAAAAIVLHLLFKKLVESPTHKNGVPLPPGPRATWFWESPLPKKHIAHSLTALVQKYGPVLSLRGGSHVTIVIGSMDAATEIMEKEGRSLADRPHLIAGPELLSGGMRLLFARAGERHLRMRRAVSTHLQPRAVQTYEELQAESAKDLILGTLNDQKRWMRHAHRVAAAVILRITYGKTTPTSDDDPEMVRIGKVSTNFQTALKPGAHLVDRIPWLRYIPWYTWQFKAQHRYELELFQDQLNRVRNDIATGGAGPSFGKMLLERTGDHHLSDDEMAYLAGTLFAAGMDTIAAGVTVMVTVAACHPDAQALVQEELDEVVGRNRVPTFGDWDMLPQLQAFLLEAMRWRPVTPLSMLHRATKDIIWNGQCIPAGATVIGCLWSISRDPVAFPDPEKFDPGRWLTEDGRVRTDMHFYTFGFGRRVCPGQHVASQALYIDLAMLLWSFRISERPDAPINLGPGSFQDLLIYHPEPFEVDFIPRIEEGRLRELLGR